MHVLNTMSCLRRNKWVTQYGGYNHLIWHLGKFANFLIKHKHNEYITSFLFVCQMFQFVSTVSKFIEKLHEIHIRLRAKVDLDFFTQKRLTLFKITVAHCKRVDENNN